MRTNGNDMKGNPGSGKYLPVFIIQTALGFEPEGFPKEALNKLVREAPIHYKYLGENFLYYLERLGIPARSKLPFAASWLAIVKGFHSTNPHVAAWLATLLYSEWCFMYWFRETSRGGFSSELSRRIALCTAVETISGNKITSVGISPQDLVIKWWLDELVLRIRAVWDKIPYAIGDTNIPPIELKGAKHSARINELVQRRDLIDLWPVGEEVFDHLLSEMKDIDYVKKHRDAEVHRHTKPYAEVFGVYGTHESLSIVWDRLGLEINRCREAIMATIGILLRKRNIA